MKIFKMIGILVVFMTIGVGGFAKMTGISIYAKPGIALFADAIGFHGRIGTQIAVKDIFGAENMTEDLFAGLAFDLSTAADGAISTLNFGFGLDIGYDINLFNDLLTVTPSATIGVGFGNVHDTNVGHSDSFSFYANPVLSIDYNINQNIKTGLSVGFPMFIHNSSVQYLYVGASFTYRIDFGGSKSTKSQKMREEIGAKSEPETVASLSFFDETSYISDLPESDDLENYNEALREIHEVKQFVKKTAYDINHLATNLATLMDKKLSGFTTDPAEAIVVFRQALIDEGVEISVTTTGFDETQEYVVKIKKPKKPKAEIESMVTKYGSLIKDYVRFTNESALIRNKKTSDLEKLISAAPIFFTDDNEMYKDAVIESLEEAKTVYKEASETLDELAVQVAEIIEMIEASDATISSLAATIVSVDEEESDDEKDTAALKELLDAEMDELSAADNEDDSEETDSEDE